MGLPNLDHFQEQHDGRQLEGNRHSVDLAVIDLEHFNLPQPQESDGLLPVQDAERLVCGVQQQGEFHRPPFALDDGDSYSISAGRKASPTPIQTEAGGPSGLKSRPLQLTIRPWRISSMLPISPKFPRAPRKSSRCRTSRWRCSTSRGRSMRSTTCASTPADRWGKARSRTTS